MIFTVAFLLSSSCEQQIETNARAFISTGVGRSPVRGEDGNSNSYNGIGNNGNVKVKEVGVKEDRDVEPPEVAHVDVGDTDTKADAELEFREQAVMDQLASPQRAAILAVRVQRRAVRRSNRKAVKMMGSADALYLAVQRQRFQRLDRYAREQGWSMSAVPADTARDERLRNWWQEWRRLRKMGLEM